MLAHVHAASALKKLKPQTQGLRERRVIDTITKGVILRVHNLSLKPYNWYTKLTLTRKRAREECDVNPE